MALFPTALDVPGQPPRTTALAVLGTCVADGFARLPAGGPDRIDHYLMSSGVHDPVPDLAWSEYDGIIVHVTLRHLLWRLVPDGEDLFHVRSGVDYASVLAQTLARLKARIDMLIAAVGGKAPLFFLAFNEPPNSYQGILVNNRRQSLYHFIRTLNDEMASALEGVGSAHYIEVNDVFRYLGDANVSDAYALHLTHAGVLISPESPAFFSAIVARASNAVSILRSENPIKLIISDLDNTLWKGVLAEHDDIVPYMHYEGWPLGYAEALLEFKRRGGLLAISSKNDHDSTLERFGVVWNDRLRIDDFCSVKINWQPKSENIAQILRETNLLPSNVLFVDDNPREIEEVRLVFPEMRFLTGQQEDWRSAILFSPQTQVSVISAESAMRTEMIQAKQHRDQLSQELSRTDYLKSLDIKIRFTTIRTSSHTQFERAFELLNKTNQFNTVGQRWDAAEMQSLFDRGGAVLALTARDKFGDNGLVALAILDGAHIVQVVMSCRVFGFGLETALLCELLSHPGVQEAGGAVTGRYTDTGKNKASASFFRDNGFEESAPGLWRLVEAPAWPDWIGRGWVMNKN